MLCHSERAPKGIKRRFGRGGLVCHRKRAPKGTKPGFGRVGLLCHSKGVPKRTKGRFGRGGLLRHCAPTETVIRVDLKKKKSPPTPVRAAGTPRVSLQRENASPLHPKHEPIIFLLSRTRNKEERANLSPVIIAEKMRINELIKMPRTEDRWSTRCIVRRSMHSCSCVSGLKVSAAASQCMFDV